MKAVAPKPAVAALERLSEELLESYLGDERARRELERLGQALDRTGWSDRDGERELSRRGAAEKSREVLVDQCAQSLARRDRALKAELTLALGPFLGAGIGANGDVFLGGVDTAGLGVRAHDDG